VHFNFISHSVWKQSIWRQCSDSGTLKLLQQYIVPADYYMRNFLRHLVSGEVDGLHVHLVQMDAIEDLEVFLEPGQNIILFGNRLSFWVSVHSGSLGPKSAPEWMRSNDPLVAHWELKNLKSDVTRFDEICSLFGWLVLICYERKILLTCRLPHRLLICRWLDGRGPGARWCMNAVHLPLVCENQIYYLQSLLFCLLLLHEWRRYVCIA
jgi:hypothetical protein